MDLLSDPSMKEIVLDFCKESRELFSELESILDDLEEDVTNSQKMEQFGQIIDRVMGAAKTIGASEISTLSELSKTIGYKASQINDAPLLEIVVAILFDTLEILNKIVNSLAAGKSETVKDLGSKTFVKRLNWLSDKFKNIERASVHYEEKAESSRLDQSSIDDLISSLGL